MDDIDTAAHDELRMLRARAYGPAADIDRDPTAAERLRELESLTATPARILGLGDRLGLLEPGYAADVVALDDELTVQRVWAAGAALSAG